MFNLNVLSRFGASTTFQIIFNLSLIILCFSDFQCPLNVA